MLSSQSNDNFAFASVTLVTSLWWELNLFLLISVNCPIFILNGRANKLNYKVVISLKKSNTLIEMEPELLRHWLLMYIEPHAFVSGTLISKENREKVSTTEMIEPFERQLFGIKNISRLFLPKKTKEKA